MLYHTERWDVRHELRDTHNSPYTLLENESALEYKYYYRFKGKYSPLFEHILISIPELKPVSDS